MRQVVKAESTKRCPACGSSALVRIGSQNLKMCADCETDIVWEVEKKEPPVYGGTKGEI